MQEIIFLKGLPASGKSTWAKQYCIENLFVKRFNKDDIREELGNPPWSKQFEEVVLKLQRERVEKALSKGFSVIIDDTNFAEKHRIFYQSLAKKYNYKFVEKFFDVPVEECVARDLGRKNPVGEAIIRSMYNKYLKPSTIKTDDRFILKQDPRLPKCIIVDLDGTLALHNGRGPFDYAKCGTDIVNIPVKHIVQSYGLLYDYNVMDTDGEEVNYIIILSGRDEICRNESIKWLDDNGIPFNHLFMRPKGDYRKDAIVKQEIYEREIKGKYYVEFILDDRDSVIRMWRDLGLLCLQVYWGDF